MPEAASGLEKLEQTCRALQAEGAGILKWSWDDYLGAVLSTYTAGDSQKVSELLGRCFPQGFDPGSIAHAPPGVQALLQSIGGLRGGQQLVTSDPGGAVVAVAALWPWSGGKTVSIRMWLVAGGAAGTAVPADVLRSWFSC